MKKSILFLMLTLAMSIAAQNKGEKSRVQWLKSATNQQALKQQQSAQQTPAANTFSQSLRKPSLLQQKLQTDKKADQVKNAVAAKTADILWNNIGTLTATAPWTETINFDPENTELIPIQFVDDYGYTTNTLCYAVRFTLAQDELISLTSSAYYSDFRIYSDPEAQQEVVWAYNLLQPLAAGTYYLLISDSGYFQWEWNTDPYQATVELRTLPATGITLPHQQNLSISKDNSVFILNTYYTVFYQFTLSNDAAVNFGSSYDREAMGENMSYLEIDLMWDDNMINVSNNDMLLKAGTYYLAVYGILWDDAAFWEEHTSIDAQLDIQTKTLAAPVDLSVPFEQDFIFSPDNAYKLAGNYSLLYSLHLDAIQMIEIKTGDRFGAVIYDKETWIDLDGFRIGERAVVRLAPGDYYLAIADFDDLYDGATPVNGHLSIGIPYNYGTLDFSETIAVGETKVGDDASLINIITDINEYYGIEQFDVAAYHFTMQEGHIYKLVMEGYAKTSPILPNIALFRAPNTGDIYADNIRGTMFYINASSGTGSLTWTADSDGDINIMFFFEKPESDVMFKLTLEETEATHTDTQGTTPAYEDITLPFVSYLHFDPAYNAYFDATSTEYHKLYRLTLAEKTLLKIEAGFNPDQGSSMFLHLFSDEARTQEIGNWWDHGEGGSQLLDAGVYYLAMSDNGYSGYNEDYAEFLVELSGSADFEEILTVTVAQLMDSPEIPVIDYAGDLSYTDAGYFVYGTSQLVTDPAFYYTNLFAKGYKLTGMNVDDEVNIANRQPEGEAESVVTIYKKEDDGSYTQVDQNYFWAGTLSFKATEACDYYIMASSANSYPVLYSNVEYPSYQVAIWTGSADDEPAADGLQLPAEILITGTTANATEVILDDTAGSVDIKLALMALEITATTQAGATVVLENHPFAWEVNDLETEASFVGIPIPYLKVETYAPATVQLTIQTGINPTVSETAHIVHSGNGFVTITGLQGKEAISLIDLNGRIVRKLTAQGATATIATNALPGGVYIVAVQNGRQLTVLKFVR